jgi:probable rRNA maturation factor
MPAASSQSCVIVVANRQRKKKINARHLKQLAASLLAELQIADAELGITLVAAREMACVNEAFLNHKGSTDVITFDHSELKTQNSKLKTALHGELFICVDDAVAQAREFKTTWQSEVIRYVIHGVLHLLGHDDHRAVARRKMKSEESRLLRVVTKSFPPAKLRA